MGSQSAFVACAVALSAILLGSERALGDDAEAICGQPPPVADERVVAEIEGRFSGLSWLDLGGSGRYEQRRDEILSRYPNADRTLIELSIFRSVCLILMGDGEMTQREKIEALGALRRDMLGTGGVQGSAPIPSEDGGAPVASFFVSRRDWFRFVEVQPQETRALRLVGQERADCRGPAMALDVLEAYAPDAVDTARWAIAPQTQEDWRRVARRYTLDLYNHMRRHIVGIVGRQLVLDQPFARLRCEHFGGLLFDLRIVPCHRGDVTPDDREMMADCGLDDAAFVERGLKDDGPVVCYQMQITQSVHEAVVRNIRPQSRAISTSLYTGGPGVSALCLDDAPREADAGLTTIVFIGHDHRFLASNLLRICFAMGACSPDAFDPAVSPPPHPRY